MSWAGRSGLFTWGWWWRRCHSANAMNDRDEFTEHWSLLLPVIHFFNNQHSILPHFFCFLVSNFLYTSTWCQRFISFHFLLFGNYFRRESELAIWYILLRFGFTSLEIGIMGKVTCGNVDDVHSRTDRSRDIPSYAHYLHRRSKRSVVIYLFISSHLNYFDCFLAYYNNQWFWFFF